eukprot:TRINITY_DN11102_c0_g1_i1.p1 TRINITY_DN11102_c0_g1~~TRINITY_DN11102_c0_g1_i1.p1  ORF type:complete len:493 (+),score=197.51 TRINITY_DN11102_c0_g1_i1:178-1479(+)
MTAWELYLDWRQMKKDRETEIPAEVMELEIVTEKDKFASLQAYCLERRQFGIVRKAVNLIREVVDAAYVRPYLYRALKETSTAQALMRWAGGSRWVDASLAYFMGFRFVSGHVWTPLSLAFSAYSNFVVEERHGFNRMTWRMFATDFIKAELTESVLGTAVYSAIFALLKHTGEKSFLYMWAFVQGLQFFMLWAYPTFIQPMFNKFTPLDPDTELYAGVKALAKEVDYPLYKCYEMDASTRSSKSNAYMFGFGKWKRIVLYDTLMKQPKDEILAVLAHELGHWKLGHNLWNMGFLSVNVFLYFYVTGRALYSDPPTVVQDVFASHGFDLARPSDDLMMAFELLLTVFLTPLSLVTGRVSTLMSRAFEYQADAFAVALGYGEALSRGLKTLSTENKSSVTPDWLFGWWHHSHPSTPERLRAIRRAMAAQKKKTD